LKTDVDILGNGKTLPVQTGNGKTLPVQTAYLIHFTTPGTNEEVCPKN